MIYIFYNTLILHVYVCISKTFDFSKVSCYTQGYRKNILHNQYGM